jgi:hydrogenase expression/formation protein HypC
MCLGVPGQVVEIWGEETGLRMGRVDFGGIRKEVCLAYLPEVAVGDYAIVHVGFAITRLDEASARESLRLFRELGLLDEELGTAAPDDAVPPACPVPRWAAPPGPPAP